MRAREQYKTNKGFLEKSAYDTWNIIEPFQDGWKMGDALIRRSVGNNEISEDQIAGSSWAVVLLNEVARMPIGFVKMAGTRVRVGIQRLLYDMNPGTPDDDFEKDYVEQIKDGRRSGKIINFRLVDENSWNSETQTYDKIICHWVNADFIKEQCASYPREHPDHQRLVLGKSAYNAGLLFPNIDRSLSKTPSVELNSYLLTIDVGESNSATHAILNYVFFDETEEGIELRLHSVSEWYHLGKEDGAKSFEAQSDDILDWLDEVVSEKDKVIRVLIDPSPPEFTRRIVKRYYIRGNKGETELLLEFCHLRNKGTKEEMTSSLQSLVDKKYGQLLIDEDECPKLVSQLRKITWEELAAMKGEDKVDDSGNYDGFTAMYYLAWQMLESGEPSFFLPHRVLNEDEIIKERQLAY